MFHKLWILFFSQTIAIYFFWHKDKIHSGKKKTMNDELLKLTGWCLANKLSTNC